MTRVARPQSTRPDTLPLALASALRIAICRSRDTVPSTPRQRPRSPPAPRAAATTPMKRSTSRSVSQTPRPRRSPAARAATTAGVCVPRRRRRCRPCLRCRSRNATGRQVRCWPWPTLANWTMQPARLACPPRRAGVLLTADALRAARSRNQRGKSSSTRKVRGSALAPRGWPRGCGAEPAVCGGGGDVGTAPAGAPAIAGGARSQSGMDGRETAVRQRGQRWKLGSGVPLVGSASGVPHSTQSVRVASFQAPQPWHSVTDHPPSVASGPSHHVRRVYDGVSG